MKKPKRIKYFMGVETYNMPYTPIEITKKQYDTLHNVYSAFILENHKEAEENSEYYVAERIKAVEENTVTNIYNFYSDGPATITLQKVVCKEGYCFKK